MSVIANGDFYIANGHSKVGNSYRGAFLLFYHKLHKGIFLSYYALDKLLRMPLSYFLTFVLMLMDVFCAIVLNMKHGNQGNTYHLPVVVLFYSWNIIS